MLPCQLPYSAIHAATSSETIGHGPPATGNARLGSREKEAVVRVTLAMTKKDQTLGGPG
jgi:hypothetical protein